MGHDAAIEPVAMDLDVPWRSSVNRNPCRCEQPCKRAAHISATLQQAEFTAMLNGEIAIGGGHKINHDGTPGCVNNAEAGGFVSQGESSQEARLRSIRHPGACLAQVTVISNLNSDRSEPNIAVGHTARVP